MVELQHYYRGKLAPPAFDLFAVFQRFEYAMKRGGFRKTDKPEAAWWTFAAAMPPDFFDRMRQSADAEILFSDPPDRLVMSGTSVDWSKAPAPVTNVVELFASISTVRNNLFHGDKSHDYGRDDKLVVAALYILNSAYEAIETDAEFWAFVSAMEYGL
jgi:hypothetical protein